MFATFIVANVKNIKFFAVPNINPSFSSNVPQQKTFLKKNFASLFEKCIFAIGNFIEKCSFFVVKIIERCSF